MRTTCHPSRDISSQAFPDFKNAHNYAQRGRPGNRGYGQFTLRLVATHELLSIYACAADVNDVILVSLRNRFSV